jgi:hypothetical protein
MPDFSRIINMAYTRILGRPADPGGLENYNRLMNAGFTEAQMRETLLRSREYADKNPGISSTAVKAPSSPKKKAKKKTAKKKTTKKSTARKTKVAGTRKKARSPRH